MSAVIMIEIVLGLIVLAGAVRFAVRDTRARSTTAGEGYAEPERTAEVPDHSNEVPDHSNEVPEHRDEQEAERPVSEVADRV
ncbi:MAG: hypothetical protein ACRDSH_26335 [Pseudonocardiaceae bacterium]